MSIMEQNKNISSTTNSQRKKFQCGWCKFKAVFSETILRHHERKHPGQELDIVVINKPSRQFNSPAKGEDDNASSSSDTRCHADSLCDDLDIPRSFHSAAIIDDNTHSRLKPNYTEEWIIKSDKNLKRQCRTKTACIKCYDILRSGAWYIQKLTDKYSLSKVRFDHLPRRNFLNFTTKFKHQLMYLDSENPESKPKDLESLPNDEIIQLVSGKFTLHTCKLCSRAFYKTSSLKSHMRAHTVKEAHKCDVCGALFTQTWTLKRHRARKHQHHIVDTPVMKVPEIRVAPEMKLPEIAPEMKLPEIAPEMKLPEIAPEMKLPEIAPEMKLPEIAPANQDLVENSKAMKPLEDAPTHQHQVEAPTELQLLQNTPVHHHQIDAQT